MCVLMPFLKLCFTAAKLLGDKQDQGELKLPSNYRQRQPEKAITSEIITRHLAYHPRKRHRLDRLSFPNLKISFI